MTRPSTGRWVAGLACGISVRVLLGAGGAALAVGLLAVAGRPSAWAAGPGFVVALVAAMAGTSAVALLLGAALLTGFLVRGGLARSGALSGAAGLGWGRPDLLRWCAPLLVAGAGLVAGAAWQIEPAAWTAVHGVKGSPAASAVALARLDRGEVVPLPDGAAARREGKLHLSAGGIEAEVTALRPDRGGWLLRELQVRGPGARWSAASVRLALAEVAGPPTSPWTMGWSSLAQRRDLDGAEGRRASLVWHRRLASGVLAPLLACLGFLLGPGLRAGRWAGLRLASAGSGLFLATRAADQLCARALLAPELAGWLPVALAVGLLLVARR